MPLMRRHPCTTKEQGSNEKFEDADCFDAPRDGERRLIAKRIGDRHRQKIQRGMLLSSLLMEEGGVHTRHGCN